LSREKEGKKIDARFFRKPGGEGWGRKKTNLGLLAPKRRGSAKEVDKEIPGKEKSTQTKVEEENGPTEDYRKGIGP